MRARGLARSTCRSPPAVELSAFKKIDVQTTSAERASLRMSWRWPSRRRRGRDERRGRPWNVFPQRKQLLRIVHDAHLALHVGVARRLPSAYQPEQRVVRRRRDTRATLLGYRAAYRLDLTRLRRRSACTERHGRGLPRGRNVSSPAADRSATGCASYRFARRSVRRPQPRRTA